MVNRYGLFAVMTTTRPEVEIEGSQDGKEWRAYVFPYKAGPLDRRPPVIGPHMPRLDWQMWFAALRERPPRWFLGFAEALLRGRADARSLLVVDPFPEDPPRFVRARLYLYRFSSLGS